MQVGAAPRVRGAAVRLFLANLTSFGKYVIAETAIFCYMHIDYIVPKCYNLSDVSLILTG